MVRKYLVVGAGFSGATLARCLAEGDATVHVIDRRDHVAGNAFDHVDGNGIRVHRYGPHLYHTSTEQVHSFLSRFTEWIPYEHRVSALYDGDLHPFPPNFMTEWKLNVEPDVILDIFYRPYTLKMWGIPLDELDPSIVNRVPRQKNGWETRYFPNDEFQFLPTAGYTALVEKMLDHPRISTYTSMEFEKVLEKHYDHVFSSAAIDEYYDYSLGMLPYRSIRFHTSTVPAPMLYGRPVVNFTHDGRFTRVTEWKQFPGHGDNPHVTTVTAEEPCDYLDNQMERYYPVKDLGGENRARYDAYRAIPNERVTFIGRTGQYVYLDMHQAVNASMQLAKKVLSQA